MESRQEPPANAKVRRDAVVSNRYATVMAVLSILAGLTVANEPLFAHDSSFRQAPGSTEGGAKTNDGTVIYGQDFFVQYNVTTAEEILRRIPGATSILDDAGSGDRSRQRGFGSVETQLLINGRRLAGKSNDVESALRRIQIQNLNRVELIRGTADEFNVRSSGVVINLVLKAGDAITSSGSATVKAHLDESGTTKFDGAVGYSSELGDLDYFVSLDKNSYTESNWGSYSRRYQDERYFFPTGEVSRLRKTKTDRELDEYTIAANSTYHFTDGDSLQINALVKPSQLSEVDFTPFVEFALDGTPVYSATDIKGQVTENRLEWELGTTFDKSIGRATKLKLLSVVNYDKQTAGDFRNRIEDDVLREISRNPSEKREVEAIVRGSLSWPVFSRQSIELGAEIAKNSLEQLNEAYFDLDDDGQAEQIEIFDPSSRVEEIRSEVFVNHSWTVNSRWTAASSAVAESSRISQRGVDINNSASFSYIKPRVDVRYSPSTNDQLRIKVERTASQLNFSNFVPKYQILLDRFISGNPDLQPETAWEYEVGFEHRLSGDQGLVEARIFYNDIQDRIESVALDLDGDGRFRTASGNIGDGSKYGLELKFGWRMSRFGMPNLLLDGRFLRQDSRVTDPFTGVERDFSMTQDYIVDLNLRHDIPDWNVAYGASFRKEGGPFAVYEWREQRWYVRQPQVNLFFQKKFPENWTMRVDVFGVSQNKVDRSREIYAENAQIGKIGQRQFYAETRDRRYTFSMTAAF